MTPMRVLLIGHQGQLARAVIKLAATSGIDCDAIGRPIIDLADAETIGPVLSLQLSGPDKPDIVINTAAYTNVDAAESDHEAAARINAVAPGEIATACAKANIPLIHISTDYVYADGIDRPLMETDRTAPTSIYGRTKLDGENAIAANWHKHVIIRTSWLYGGSTGNFYATMDRLSQSRDVLLVVDDQTGCPTLAHNLAEAILKVARQVASGHAHWGIFNYCDDSAMSWAQFATKIFTSLGRTQCQIEPVSTQDYGAHAPRPAWSVLDCHRIELAYGVSQASFEKALCTLAAKP